MKTKILKWLAILSLGLTGCYDYSNFENFALEPISPSYVFPLVKDSVTMADILEQADSIDLIKENPDHSYSIIFRDSVDAGFATDQFNIGTQNYSETITVPGLPVTPIPPIATFPFDENYNETINTTIDGGGTVELKEVNFSSGIMQITVTNNFHHNVDGNLVINSLKLKNSANPYDSLVLHFTLTSYGSSFNQSINLSDYNFDAYNNSTGTWNSLTFRAVGSITTTNNPINSGDNISILVSVSNPTFQKITGKINYSFSQAEQTYSTDMFQSMKNIKIHLSDPKLNFYFTNSYGIPMSLSFNKFEFTDSVGVSVPVTTTGTGPNDLSTSSKNYINYITSAQQIAYDTLKLNKDNSNIVDVFNCAPKNIIFGGAFEVGDNTTNHNFFVNESSTIKIKSEVEIPVYGWVKVSSSDTTDISDLPDLQTEDYKVSDLVATFSLIIRNELPLNIYLQAYFVNDANVVQTKLFDGTEQLIIQSSEVNSSGITTKAMTKKTEVALNKAKYDLMKKATKMIVTYRLLTGGADQQSIKILSTNRIGIQARISFKGTVKPKF